MFSDGTHKDLKGSLESIGACVAIFEASEHTTTYKLVAANTLFSQVIGSSVSESIGAKFDAIFERYIAMPLKECFVECTALQGSTEREIVVDSNGKSRWWRFIVSPIISGSNNATRLLVTTIEITDKKLLEAELANTSQRFEAVVESAYDGIITIDNNHNIKLMNTAAKDIFQLTGNELLGEPLTKLIPQRYRHNHHDYVEGFKASVINSRPMQSRASVYGLRKDGTEFPLEVTISKINVAGKIEMTAVLRDISERARLIQELSRAATEDHLTGLPNRRSFERDFEKELQRSSRFKSPLSLVIIDIDHFKNVNDDHGHNIGDKVLVELAEQLKSSIRNIDTAARWGGEEFVVFLPETDEQGAITWSEKVRKCIENTNYQVENELIHITASFGIAALSDDLKTPEQLFEHADKRLYQAKSSGRNKVGAGS